MTIDGIFNINKPSGMTSFDVVATVRRLTKQRRVGHAGTLDPAAVGVLPVCVGQATKVVEYLTDTSKAYCAEIFLGKTTDTYDAEGRVTSTHPLVGIDRERIERALESFIGEIEQIPPMYSAIKVSGKKLYQIAREGREIERSPRKVKIFGIELLAWESPALTIKVECSKGTYIRSLAYDLGKILGCGGYLQSLVRLKSGPFTIAEAIPLEQLIESFELSYWQTQIYSPDEVLLDWPAAILNDDKERAVRNGQDIHIRNTEGRSDGALDVPHGNTSGSRCRAYATDGELIGVLELDLQRQLWHPDKIFARPVK